MRLSISSPGAAAEGIEPKDSIAINGVCLTAVAVDGSSIAFDVIPETLSRSTLGACAIGDPVNVELSLRLGDRLGGHFVYGHVDRVAEVSAVVPEGQGVRMTIRIPDELRRYIVEKGYIAVDGVSLTVAAVTGECFEIALIPETLVRTTLGARRAGDMVNLEIDPVARYALGAVTAYA